ncbi:asparagine synthase-related protein [Nonomuraea sp. NPDC050556]|uniref:asparagine synthase-related protein n=1 Tax=Nonomuraea sp. NPDC050556 TaxID=3364369 RepID=UPI00378E1307
MKEARDAARAAFPVPWDTVTPGEWRAPEDRSALLAWSNEGADALGLRGGGAEGVSGAATFKASPDGIEAATSLIPADPVYYAETDELHVIGNRALLVHLVANGRVEYDVLALQSMARQGYFLSEETPFTGVRALPPNSTLEVSHGISRLTTRDLPHGDSRTGVDDLASALLNALTPLRSTQEPVRLTLTGGRDSRLIAAMLHAADIPFTATTYGTDRDPDVVIARRIAKQLGVDHQVISQAREGQVTVTHPLDRARDIVRVCEGMTSAYENVVPYAPFTAKPTMGGQAGEILRGGYLSGMASIASPAVTRKVNTLFQGSSALFTAEANEHAASLAAPWQSDNPRILDHLYVRYRTGRWHAAARTGALRRGTQVQPYLDAAVARIALATDPEWRWSERPVHDLIAHFSPRLARIPLQGKPWRFTKHRWWHRKPTPDAPVWNWRHDAADHLYGTVRNSEPLARIVHMDRLPDASPTTLWHLYTVAVLLSEDLTTPPQPGGPPMTFHKQ